MATSYATTVESVQAMTDQELAIELKRQIELMDREEVFWEPGMMVIRESLRRLEMVKQFEAMGDIKTRKIQELADCVFGLLSEIKAFNRRVLLVAPDAEFILKDKRI